MLFQLVRLELNENGNVVDRMVTRPLYGLRDHAMAMAEFEAARCFGKLTMTPRMTAGSHGLHNRV